VIVPRTARTRMLDFEGKLEHIAAGEEAARAVIPRIRELLAEVENEKPNRSLSRFVGPR
jgi:hypothetical protein